MRDNSDSVHCKKITLLTYQFHKMKENIYFTIRSIDNIKIFSRQWVSSAQPWQETVTFSEDVKM